MEGKTERKNWPVNLAKVNYFEYGKFSLIDFNKDGKKYANEYWQITFCFGDHGTVNWGFDNEEDFNEQLRLIE